MKLDQTTKERIYTPQELKLMVGNYKAKTESISNQDRRRDLSNFNSIPALVASLKDDYLEKGGSNPDVLARLHRLEALSYSYNHRY